MKGLRIEQTAEYEYRVIASGWEGEITAMSLAVVEAERAYREPSSPTLVDPTDRHFRAAACDAR
jgi:hypothetical protein